MAAIPEIDPEIKGATAAIPELDPEIKELLLAYYHYYLEFGSIPDVLTMSKKTRFSQAKIAKLIKNPVFDEHARAVGLPWKSQEGLTVTQMLAISTLTNPTDKRPVEAKLKSLGVSYAQYRIWTRQPEFSAKMHSITEGMLTDHLPDFLTALTNKGMRGDLNSIKYINELSGRHDPNRQAALEFQVIVGRLLEVIMRNVTDPIVLNRITEEFKLVMGTTKPLTQGEISNAELHPQLQFGETD